MYLRSSAVRILEIMCPLDGDVGTSKVVFVCGLEPVWCGRDNVFDVCIARAWDRRSMDTVMAIPF